MMLSKKYRKNIYIYIKRQVVEISSKQNTKSTYHRPKKRGGLFKDLIINSHKSKRYSPIQKWSKGLNKHFIHTHALTHTNTTYKKPINILINS